MEWRGRLEGAGKMDVRQFVERGYSPYETLVDIEGKYTLKPEYQGIGAVIE